MRIATSCAWRSSAGSTWSGGAPHIDADPVGHIKVCLELAAEFGRPVDLHMDEHMRSSMDLSDLAVWLRTGFRSR